MENGALKELGVSLRDIVEAAIAFGVIWSQIRAHTSSLRNQGRRIGKVEKELVELKARHRGDA
jgi:hypothetical protein